MENGSKFIELKLNRDLCLDTENPTQEYYYEDLLSIQNIDSVNCKSTKRKLKDMSISKRREKEFNSLISERGIAERDALRMIDRYSQIGDGYDKSDPFIDDSDIRVEEEDDVATKIEGFYLNEGPVEYRLRDDSESLFTPTIKRRKTAAPFSLPRFVNDYIAKSYPVLEECAAILGLEGDPDPMLRLLQLVPLSMARPINSTIEGFFRGEDYLEEFVRTPPAVCPLPHPEPIASGVAVFLQSMAGKCRPDFEDAKVLFVLYANCKRHGLTPEEWETVLGEVAVRGDVSRMKELFQEIVKYFCGSIDNALISHLTTDRMALIQSSDRPRRVDLTEPQKRLIKAIFVIFLMATKVDRMSEQVFLQQVNTFNKYFVNKLGGVRSGVNRTILLNASQFPLKKVQRIAKSTTSDPHHPPVEKPDNLSNDHPPQISSPPQQIPTHSSPLRQIPPHLSPPRQIPIDSAPPRLIPPHSSPPRRIYPHSSSPRQIAPHSSPPHCSSVRPPSYSLPYSLPPMYNPSYAVSGGIPPYDNHRGILYWSSLPMNPSTLMNNPHIHGHYYRNGNY